MFGYRLLMTNKLLLAIPSIEWLWARAPAVVLKTYAFAFNMELISVQLISAFLRQRETPHVTTIGRSDILTKHMFDVVQIRLRLCNIWHDDRSVK